MLKLKIDSFSLETEITNNDRGDWSIKQTPDSPVIILEGFGGENFIIISLMGMQSFKTSIGVQFVSVDSEIEFRSSLIDGYEVSDRVNEIIAEWYRDHGVIETEEELEAHLAQFRRD